MYIQPICKKKRKKKDITQSISQCLPIRLIAYAKKTIVKTHEQYI